jgi:hypothetical protein
VLDPAREELHVGGEACDFRDLSHGGLRLVRWKGGRDGRGQGMHTKGTE